MDKLIFITNKGKYVKPFSCNFDDYDLYWYSNCKISEYFEMCFFLLLLFFEM